MIQLPHGYKWLLRVVMPAAIALIWIVIFRNIHWGNNFFSDTIPGFQLVISDIGLFFTAWFVMSKLNPVLTNSILRWLRIPRVIASEGLDVVFFICSFKFCSTDFKTLYNSFNSHGWTKDIFIAAVDGHSFDFWWLIMTRIIMPVLIAALPVWTYEMVNKVKSTKLYRQWFLEGRGGSASFAGSLTYKKMRVKNIRKTNGIIVGNSLFSDDPYQRTVELKGSGHLITCGSTGSGKKTTMLNTVLATYDGSCIVFAPKAELTNETIGRRSSKDWIVKNNIKTKTITHIPNSISYVNDPFQITGQKSHKYNLLSEIDINASNARALLSAISDGCVLPEPKDIHFSEMSKLFLEGLICFVLSEYPKEKQNLCFVTDLINNIDPDLGYVDPTRFKSLLKAMAKNDACGGLPMHAASKMFEVGDREHGSIISTLGRSLKFLTDPMIRESQTGTDFRFADINKKTTTIYITIPDNMLSEQMRYMRVLISLSLAILKSAESRPKTPTLLIIDELPRLGGRINELAEAYAILRGFGARIWSLIQNIGQLKADYPNRWDSMVANSNLQFFGVSDMDSAKLISERLGSQKLITYTGEGKDKKRFESHELLLSPAEVMMKLGKNTNRQIILRDEGAPLRLERCTFMTMKMDGKRFRELSPWALKGCFENY